MLMKIVFFLSVWIISSLAVRIPFIRHAVFIPLSSSNSRTIANHNCSQCLCMDHPSSLLLNCFPNNTCQFFSSFPRKYNIQPMNNATLYFPQGIFPSAEQCCVPNVTSLVDKLKIAPPIYGSVSSPRRMALDDHGYIVTASQATHTLIRFNSTDLTLLDNTPGLFTNPYCIQYYNGNYYVGLVDRIVVINSSSLKIQNHITSSHFNGISDMIFLNNGDTLVVTSYWNSRLLFFNRPNDSSTNYTFTYQQIINYTMPRGMFRVNDSFFYIASYSSNTIWSYSVLANTTQWKESLFIDARQRAPASAGITVTVDECGRSWFSLSEYGVHVFDARGVFLANFILSGASIFVTIITENYVIYLLDINSQRIIRLDPDIEC